MPSEKRAVLKSADSFFRRPVDFHDAQPAPPTHRACAPLAGARLYFCGRPAADHRSAAPRTGQRGNAPQPPCRNDRQRRQAARCARARAPFLWLAFAGRHRVLAGARLFRHFYADAAIGAEFLFRARQRARCAHADAAGLARFYASAHQAGRLFGQPGLVDTRQRSGEPSHFAALWR